MGYSPVATDADTTSPGHQVTVPIKDPTTYTITVTSASGSVTKAYTIEITRYTLPGAPGGLDAQASYRQVELSWNDPSNSDIDSYQYRVSDDGGNTWDPDWTEIDGSDASTTGHTLSDLNHRKEYTFGVRAVVQGTAGAAASDTATPAATTVPHDWDLRPPGIATGKTFRLLIVTNSRRNGESGDVDDYNDHVQDAVDGGHSAIQDYSSDFRALVGTKGGASPRDNTHSNTNSDGRGEQIWWLKGPKAADNYADFYDGSWDHTNPVRLESGNSRTFYDVDANDQQFYRRIIWTGARADGARSGSRHLGSDDKEGYVGVPYFEDGPLRLGGRWVETDEKFLSLYGLSPVFLVEAPDAPYATTAAITTDPPNGTDYRTGEVVKATVTFSEDVTVMGTPQLPLRIGGEKRNADYVAGDSSSTVLSFSYTVTDDDTDRDGISIDAFALKLNGGSIKRADTNVDAALTHTRVLDDDDHKVNLPPLITGVEVTSTPQAANDTYGLGEDIEITVTFDKAVEVEGDVEFGISAGGRKKARLKSGSGTTELVFAYTVQADDEDDDGIWIGNHNTDHPTFDLQDGQSVTGVDSGRPALLEHSVEGTQSDHKVDGINTDATLSSLTLSGISLDQTFTAGAAGTAVTSFTATTDAAPTTVTAILTATPTQSGASVDIDPDDADTNTTDHEVDLDVGDTVITVAVTSSNGDVVRTYTITVTRPAGIGVPHDWDLRPPGVATGKTFRLLIVTSDRRTGQSGDVDDYNDHVQDAVASGHSAIQDYSSEFRALVGTKGGASPRDNTHSNKDSDGRGEQIWWLKGPKAADNYVDFYDGDWDHTNPVRLESGNSRTFYDVDATEQQFNRRIIWTGSRFDGVRSGSRHLGSDGGQAYVGVPYFENGPLRYGSRRVDTYRSLSLYGLSPVFLVEAPDAPYAMTAAITTDPANGTDYRTGEVVKAAVTFSEDVTVVGTPQLPLQIGDEERDADYVAGDSSSTVLSFSYTVTDDDTDRDGISIDAFALKLNGGSIKRTDTNVDAALTHTRVLDDDEQLVNLRPFITDIEVTSTPQATNANDTYGLGEDIEITVTFSEAVNVTGDVDFGLSAGGAKRARLARGNGTTELVFAYTVQASDDDDNGIFIGNQDSTNATLALQADQSIIGAVSGLRADLDHDEEGRKDNHKVDGSLTGADATLSSLTLSDITLVPAFAPGATAYTATTRLSSTTVTITISQGQNGATGRITAPTDADLNASGHQVTLAEDADTFITVTVTSSNSDSMRTYTVTVTRQPATEADATLSVLALSGGITLVPAFDPRTTAYAATTSLSSTTVTATASQSGANMDIDPDDADTNTTDHDVNLAEGDTVITVTVISTNGDSTRTYTITVTHEAAVDSTAPSASSAQVSADGTTIDIVFDEDLDTTGTEPAVSAFDVSVDGGTAVNPTSVAFHASDADTVVLTMATADTIAAGGTVTVAYDKPTSNALADAASNEVADFTQTAPNRPAAPVVTLTVGNEKLTAAWTAPANGGGAITGYDVEWRTASQTWAQAATAGQSDTAAADATGHEITGLTNNTEYTVRVRAENDAGDGPWSAEASETPIAGDTTAPSVDSATVSSDGTTIDIVFDESLDETSTPSNTAFLAGISGIQTDRAVPSNVAVSDDTVTLTIRSGNTIAAGAIVTLAYTAPSTNALADASDNEVESFTGTDAIAVLNRPAAPVVTLTAGNEKLTAAWTAPANGGSPITGYEVEWKTAAQTWAQAATAGQSDTAAADATGHEITGLTNNTAYTVRVRAENDAGDGPWSAEASETPVSAITQVTVEFGAASYTATEGGTAATVTVNLSADPERSVTIPITATGNGGADTSDYSLSANSVTIAGGSTSATFTVTATDDSVDDDGESVNLSFGTNLPDGVSEGTQRTATVSLTDNDGAMPVAVTVEFGAASYTAIEGRGAVTITVTLSADPERTVTIPITVPENGGADTSDYSLSANPVTINSGDTSATFTVTATDDDIYDGEGNDETLTLGFGMPPGGVETGTQNETEVSILDNDIEWGSDLLPDDAEVGDEFRLLFVTSGEVYPTSSDIDVYNQFVQDAAAGGHADIQDYSSLFRALASTASVSALDNTATKYTSSNLGVPIWWLNGANVADDYRDFYDDSWDQGDPGSNETGSEVDFSPTDQCRTSALVWTGSNSDGEAQNNNKLGDNTPTAGLPCQTGGEIEFSNVADTFDYPLYGLSYVLQAALPDGPYVTDVGVHFEPEDSADDNGVYVTGDTIRVAVTYSEDVVVGGTGTPTFPLQIGSTTVQAAYDADKSTADQLVFTHVVVAGEVDDNGISSGGNLLTLPSTASITAADDDTEDAYLGPLNLSTELDVNSAPRILDVEVTSTPQAASDTYGLGEDIEITVTFSQAVHLEGDVLFRFNTGNGQRQARLARGNDSKALVFAYTVKSGDEDDNGIFIAHPNHNNHPTLQLETDVPGQDDQTIVGVATGLDAEIEHASPPSSSLSNHKIDATETGADATLSALSLSGGITLDPVFSADTATTSFTTTSFTATTSLSSITVTATASQSGASADIDPDDADTNTTDHDVNLGLGDTVITVTVTSTNGDSMRTYTVTVTREVDTSPPSPSSARVSYDGRSIDVVFDEPLDTTRSEPPASAFDVTIDGGTAVNPTSVDFHATDADTVTLTMATPIAVQATVSVAYTDPGDATSLADQIGFKVGTFTGAMATNGIAVTAEFGAASYTAAEGGGAVTVTVTLSADPQRNVTIPIAAAGADDGDYSRSAESASFDNGATTAAFAVTAVDDRVYDGGVETLTLSFSSLPSKVTAGTQATAVVSLLDNDIPAASSLVPAGVSAGNGFRLLFVTSDTRDARSTDIDDYNAFVQNAAASGHADIQPFSSLFRALASTLSVSALDNTATNHTTAEPGVPIFWLAGPQAADDYDDFYDGGWDHRDPGRDENGAELDFGGDSNVWTGTNSDGTVNSRPLGGNPSDPNFGTSAEAARPGQSQAGHEIESENVNRRDTERLYGLSLVLYAAVTPPPDNLRAVEEKGGVRLTWQPPDGAAVTGYRIERRRSGGQDSGPQRSHGQPRDHHTLVEDTGNTETSYVDESAEQGVAYEYRVSARNESGPGEESDWVRVGPASASNTPATGAPTIRGTAQVGQTLTADTSGIADADGLSGETFTYQWVSSDGTTDTDIENATGSTYTLVDADRGRSIKVRVTFTDDGGNEETLTSAPTGPVFGDGLPGAPRNLTATPGNKEVTLSWDPPADNGNAPATRYRIEWRVDGKDFDKNHWGTARSTTYTTNDQANLANGVKYFFRVKAENDDGNSYGPYGPSSGEVSATPTSGSAVDLGTPVLSDTETLHHGMVRLDWEDIEDAGWYVVQYYHVEGGEWLDLPAEGVDIAFHGSNAVVSNLHGLSWLRVGAASCDGASEWSQIEELYGTNASDWEGVPVPEVEEGDEIEPCPVVLGTPVLSGPENLHHRMVRLDWQDIEDAGWYVVQYYHLEGGEWLDLPAAGVDIAFHGSSAVVSNLHGLSWLRVRAMSCAGASEWSQIEQLFGTKESDWEGVPVPEVAEGDEIEPCDEDADTSDNSPATGAPTIAGTAQVGEMLTANTSGIADADGLSSVQYEYQWLADNSDISGATSLTYTLADTDEGKAIKVQVSFTDDAGNEETLTSAATDAVAAELAPNSPATGVPTISGTAQVGETLTANTSGIADEDGLDEVSFTYQWLADDSDISGATNATYILVDADEGKAIKVEVTFTDDAGHDESLTSEATDAVAAAPTPNSPATGAPTINGTAQVGEVLEVDTSGIADADGLTNVSFTYQWMADDAEIAGAAGSTYTLTDSEESKAISVRVSFTDDAGNDESLTSSATDAVAAAPTPNNSATGAPSVSGTAQVRETLTANTSDIADADGLTNVTYSYQWLADDAEIAGATSLTYTLAETDEGKAIKVEVTFTDDAGNGEALTSAATDAVATAEPSEPPDKPKGLDATAAHDSVTLTWDDPGDDSITGYVILRRIPGVDPEGHFDELVANTGTSATTYTDGTVSAETRYTYRIKAINGAGTSERSRWVHIKTQEVPVPDKPKGLDATASHDSVTLTWDDPVDDSITGYVILRRVRVNDQGGDFSVLVANTETAATTYTDDTVAASLTYTYRIKAINEHGVSERSRWVHVDTPAAP